MLRKNAAMKYFIALVIKSRLLNGNQNIPDVLFVAAKDKEEAITLISKKQFTDSLWVKGKSICGISKLIPLEGFSNDAIVCNDQDSYREFVRLLNGNEPIPAIRRRRKKQ